MADMPHDSTHIPAGAVIPFFLYPNQVKSLEPVWLPANGQKVNDNLSPINGSTLPDLSNAFVLGAPATDDIVAQNPHQGLTNLKLSLNLTGIAAKCTAGDFDDVLGDTSVGSPPRFVVDTTVDEVQSANHHHEVTVGLNIDTPVPLPPYAKLIYLVKVRP